MDKPGLGKKIETTLCVLDIKSLIDDWELGQLLEELEGGRGGSPGLSLKVREAAPKVRGGDTDAHSLQHMA